MSELIRRPSADRDLVEIFRYYAREGGIRIADRFFAEAEATFARLAGMPRIGTPYDPEERLFADLRSFPVSRHRSYLVFYRPIAGGIEVVRVLHGARDIASILAEDFDLQGEADDEAGE